MPDQFGQFDVQSIALLNSIANEQDMLNLSQDDLIKYYNAASTLVQIQTSSYFGLEEERKYYQTLADQGDSTISGLGLEIIASQGRLSLLYGQRDTYQSNSSIYAEEIFSTINAISNYDIIIRDYNSSLSGFLAEDSTLIYVIGSTTTKYKNDCDYYSSLVRTYDTKRDDYITLMNNISTISSFYTSSLTGYTRTYGIWSLKNSTLLGVEAEYSTLTSYEISTILASTITRQDADDAYRVFVSTSASVEYLSSLYNTLLADRDYILSLSNATDRKNEFSVAKNTYDQWFRQRESLRATIGYQVGGGDSGPSAPTSNPYFSSNFAELASGPFSLQDVERYLSNAAALLSNADASYKAAQSNADSLKTAFDSASTITYQTLLDNYDTLINFELSTMYEYSNLERVTREIDIPYYTSVRDSNSTLEAAAIADSTFYGLAYISTLDGVAVLNTNDSTILGQIKENSTQILYYEGEINRLVLLLGEYQSSFEGYSTISSIKTQAVNQATSNIATYDAQYLSIGNAITLYNQKLTDVESTIASYKVQSTVLTLSIADTFVDEQIYANRGWSNYYKMEKGTYQYRESYVRELRLSSQNGYEDRVLVEINRASNDATTRIPPVTDFTTLINMNEGTITAALNTFCNVTNFLDSFTILYNQYDNVVRRYDTLVTQYGYYKDIRKDVDSWIMSSLILTNNPDVLSNCANALVNSGQKANEIAGLESDLGTAKGSLGEMILAIQSLYKQHFNALKRQPIEDAISTILYASYESGKAAAALLS